MFRIEVPDHAGLRDQAQDLSWVLPSDLAGDTVVLDCAGLIVGTPSFLDEIVKQVLIVRHAAALEVRDAPVRAGDLLKRSAHNRGVGERVTVTLRTAA